MRRLCNLAMILSTITVPVIAHAFENAAATFTITPTEVSGIGPSETVEFTVSGAALSNVKRVFISISAAENSFDIANTALSTGADFSGFLNLGTQFDGTNAFTLSLASFGAGFTGDGVIGTITIPTTAAYSTSMTETIIITEIRVGPSSSEEDVFAEQDLGLAVDVNAGAPAPPMMTIMELTDADLATLSLTDGSIADWEALGPADLTEADFVALSVGDGAPIAAADLSYRIWTRWHAASDLLYVAMERVDDVHVGGGSGNLWHYDGMELMVDGDHSGGDYSNSANSSWDSDEQWLNTHRTAQQYVGAPDVAGTDHVVSGAGIAAVSDPPYADGGGATDGATPGTSVVEFYVTPFDNLLHDDMSESAKSDLFTDKIIGFMISVPDFDASPGAYHGFHNLNGEQATWRYADRFVDARLVSSGTPVPAAVAPRVRVNLPDGGEVFGADTPRRIHWFADSDIANVTIEFSADNGANWDLVDTVPAAPGEYDWQVPALATTQGLIRVSDAADADPIDVSNANFTIENSISLVPGPWRINDPADDALWLAGTPVDLNTDGSVDGADYLVLIAQSYFVVMDGSASYTIPQSNDRVEWDWGDGSGLADIPFPATHIYTGQGCYTVTATAYDDNSQSLSVPTSVCVTPPAPSLPFVDAFDALNTDVWTIIHDVNGVTTAVIGGELVVIGTSENTNWNKAGVLSPVFELGDFETAVDVKASTPSGTAQLNGIRANFGDHYVGLSWDPRFDRYLMDAREPGYFEVANRAGFGDETTVFHNLELERDGTTIRGYVDGNLVGEVTRPGFAGPVQILLSQGSQVSGTLAVDVSFDNFEIFEPLPPAPSIMTIMELTDGDLATLDLSDGSIADWEALGAADLTEADFVALNVGDGAPIAAADLSYRIWTRWHASTDLLYVAMERVDDVHVGGGSGNLWHYDGIELMVDGDHSGGDYSNSANTSWDSDEQWLNTHRTAQQYIGAPDVSGTDHVVSGAGIDVVSDPPYADGGGSTDGATPATSVVEFYVTPFDNLLHDNMSASAVSDLFTDKIIGFMISVPDFDTSPGSYHGFYNLNGEQATWRYADRFVDAQLVSAGAPVPAAIEPRVRVNLPDGGEVFGANTTRRIHWFADTDIANVTIEFSADNGASWDLIDTVPANGGVYAWQVPALATTQGLVRVSDAADADPIDVSDATFTVENAIDISFDYWTLNDPSEINLWLGTSLEADLDQSGTIDANDYAQLLNEAFFVTVYGQTGHTLPQQSARIEWDWGDGSPIETGPFPGAHVYAQQACYNVTIKSYDDDDAYAEWTGRLCATPPPVNLPYADGFDALNSDFWTVFEDIPGVTVSTATGELTIAGSSSNTTWQGAGLISSVHDVQDFIAEVDLKAVNPGVWQQNIGILALVGDHAVGLNWEAGANRYMLEVWDPDSQIVGTLSAFGDESTAFHQLKLYRQGTIITAYVDGNVVGTVDRPGFAGDVQVQLLQTSNYSGLFDVDVRFDNFYLEDIAPPELPVIPAWVAAAPPVLDGDLTEWLGSGPPQLVQSDFSSTSGITGAVPTADQEIEVWLAWDDATNLLYLAARVTDDAYGTTTNTDPSGVFRSDDIEVYLDADNSGGAYNGSNAHAQQYVLNPGSQQLVMFPHVISGPPEAGWSVARNGTVYTYELALPGWNDISSAGVGVRQDFTEGQVVALSLGFADFESDADADANNIHAFNSLNGASGAWGNTDVFVEFELGRTPPPPLETFGLTVAAPGGNCGIEPQIDCETLRAGFAAGATADIDALHNEVEQPPAPPGGLFDVRFVTPTGLGLILDLRNHPAAQDPPTVWSIKLQSEIVGYPLVFSWDSASLPVGGVWTLEDTQNGADFADVNLNTDADGMFEITDPAITEVRLVYSIDVAAECAYDLPSGWSMISICGEPTSGDASLATNFPGAASLFGFGGGYFQASDLSVGRGYWINMPSASQSTISVTAATSVTLDLPVRWSMVGGPHGDVIVSAAQTTNPDIASVFGFSGGYIQPTTLASAAGYWLNMSNAGQIVLTAGAAARPVPLPPEKTFDGPILWARSGDLRQVIELGVEDDAVMALPPLPPMARALDARVQLAEIDTWQIPASAPLQEYVLRVQGEAVSLNWDIPEEMAGQWELALDDRLVTLSGTGTVELGELTTVPAQIGLRRVDSLPQAYHLDANYPNPFNPSTTIRYALKKSGPVSLKIYDITGQLIRELISETQVAGRHQIEWDGRSTGGMTVSSGVYFYELQADRFHDVKKMLLMK